MILKGDSKLLILFFLLSFLIVIRSYYNTDGYLSPDSTKYLQLAKNLSENKGLYITDLSNPSGKSYFAIWQCGYPIMIFLLSKLTSLSVFWASKLLNIIFIGLSFIIFRVLFKQNAFWFGLVFMFNSILETFTYTWSEAPFIFGLFWFSISVYKIMNGEQRIVNNYSLFIVHCSLLVSCLFLFFTRYIGAFSFGIVFAILIIQLIRKNYKEAVINLIILLVLIVTAYLYLHHNKIANGYATGLMRIDRRDSILVLFKKLVATEFKELILFNLHNKYRYILLFLAIVIEGSAFVYIYKVYKVNLLSTLRTFNFKNSLWLVFFIVGLAYWCSIIAMRFRYQFDQIDFRLLCPSTFLFAMALLSYLTQFSILNSQFSIIKEWVIYLFLLLMLVYYIPDKKLIVEYYIKGNYSIKQDYVDYNTNIKNIQAKYSKIPSNSLVLFGNKHINYLREDISVFRPLYREPIQPFVLMILKDSKAANIYIEVETQTSKYNNHESVVNYMAANKGKDFVKIKP